MSSAVESSIRIKVRSALKEELQRQTGRTRFVDTRALDAGDDLVQINATLDLNAITNLIVARIFGEG